MISNILDTKLGQIIISIILGLGLALMFSKSCVGQNCYIVRAPDNKEITQNIYQFDNECYKFSPEISHCGNSKKMNVVKSNSLLI